METTANAPQPVENQPPKKDNFFKKLVEGLLGRNKQVVDARRAYALGGKNPVESTNQEAAVNPPGDQSSLSASENNSAPKSSSPIDQRGIGY